MQQKEHVAKTFSSEYYNAITDGYMGNVNTLSELQLLAGYTNETASELCGVSLSTYRRWKRKKNPNLASLRLLAVMAGYLPWDKWKGWEMHNGYLFPPGYSKNGIPPGEFFSFIFKNQYLRSIEKKLKTQEKEIIELKKTIQSVNRTPVFVDSSPRQSELQSGSRAERRHEILVIGIKPRFERMKVQTNSWKIKISTYVNQKRKYLKRA